MGSPATSAVMYWPASVNWSTRPTICQVRLKTLRRSSSASLGSVYQEPGMVCASDKGALASKPLITCSMECSIYFRRKKELKRHSKNIVSQGARQSARLREGRVGGVALYHL